ncbi:hypothetical protein APY03_5681 [Variovorax sp. WDL1]|nr:hypothetical protein APY03_5681 [Variovorax sp. WDL1]
MPRCIARNGPDRSMSTGYVLGARGFGAGHGLGHADARDAQ